MITWRRLTPADFPLLRRWLAEPHVARWWNHDTETAAVERDFGPAARGEEPSEDFLALLDGEPVGLVQRCRLADYPDELAEFSSIVPVSATAVTIDYLIGDPNRAGRGLGPRLISSMVERTWQDFPDTPEVVVAVVAANRASWRALEKAGAARIGTGELAPDNPIDDPSHHLYRFDRPTHRALSSGGDQPDSADSSSSRG